MALQQLIREECNEQYGFVSIDTFLKMATDKVIYEEDVYEISSQLCSAAIDMMHTKQGMIIDHVITSERIFNQLIEMLKAYNTVLVHVTCPVAELIRRENSRKDRSLGSAQASYDYLYPKDCYDVTVDTFSSTGKACALQIVNAMKKKQEE